MTLLQLKYFITVANKNSINEAAKELFISQPSLSNSIRELEKEIHITLFTRTSRGILLTPEGEEFLGYAKQVVQQMELLEEKYLNATGAKQRFSVSTQHYAFTANAFVELIKEFGADEYEFTLRETKTFDIIQDVKELKSELGVLYINDFNEPILMKLIKESNLIFTELFKVRPHVFVCRDNPLAASGILALKDLEEYPCITFEQGKNNSLYFSEEILNTVEHKKSIKVTDRAALINLMIGVNGYTIATGVYPSYLHEDDITAIPLDVDDVIRVGVIKHKDITLTRLGQIYMDALKNIAESV